MNTIIDPNDNGFHVYSLLEDIKNFQNKLIKDKIELVSKDKSDYFYNYSQYLIKELEENPNNKYRLAPLFGWIDVEYMSYISGDYKYKIQKVYADIFRKDCELLIDRVSSGEISLEESFEELKILKDGFHNIRALESSEVMGDILKKTEYVIHKKYYIYNRKNKVLLDKNNLLDNKHYILKDIKDIIKNEYVSNKDKEKKRKIESLIMYRNIDSVETLNEIYNLIIDFESQDLIMEDSNDIETVNYPKDIDINMTKIDLAFDELLNNLKILFLVNEEIYYDYLNKVANLKLLYINGEKEIEIKAKLEIIQSEYNDTMKNKGYSKIYDVQINRVEELITKMTEYNKGKEIRKIINSSEVLKNNKHLEYMLLEKEFELFIFSISKDKNYNLNVINSFSNIIEEELKKNKNSDKFKTYSYIDEEKNIVFNYINLSINRYISSSSPYTKDRNNILNNCVTLYSQLVEPENDKDCSNFLDSKVKSNFLKLHDYIYDLNPIKKDIIDSINSSFFNTIELYEKVFNHSDFIYNFLEYLYSLNFRKRSEFKHYREHQHITSKNTWYSEVFNTKPLSDIYKNDNNSRIELSKEFGDIIRDTSSSIFENPCNFVNKILENENSFKKYLYILTDYTDDALSFEATTAYDNVFSENYFNMLSDTTQKDQEWLGDNYANIKLQIAQVLSCYNLHKEFQQYKEKKLSLNTSNMKRKKY